MAMTHIYCGDGKGKTTAAMGLAVRGAGAGLRVHILQLLKGSPTAELNSLSLIPNITVSRPYRDFGFTFTMTEADKAELTVCHNELLKKARELMTEKQADMLIIDEFFAAYNCGLLDRELAEELVFQRDGDCELVLTGRAPEEKFIEAADYVSEINAVKHPFENGVDARYGIEF